MSKLIWKGKSFGPEIILITAHKLPGRFLGTERERNRAVKFSRNNFVIETEMMQSGAKLERNRRQYTVHIMYAVVWTCRKNEDIQKVTYLIHWPSTGELGGGIPNKKWNGEIWKKETWLTDSFGFRSEINEKRKPQEQEEKGTLHDDG
jgi:hypothetical protein